MFDFFSGMLLFGAAFIGMVVTYIIENIVAIIIAILMLVILWCCFSKWPGVTIVSLIIFLIAIWGIISLSDRIEKNNTTVKLYVSSDTCAVYDKEDNIVQIPAGAIIARYVDESERQSENHNVFGFINHCYWYYNNEVNHFFISNSHETTYSNLPLNRWNTVELSEITYKEFKRADWWIPYIDKAAELASIALQKQAALEDLYELLDQHPFEQQYWIIFTEGSRDDRIEMSTVNSPVGRNDLHIVWDGNLELNNEDGQSECNQYYLDKNGEWSQIGTYGRLSDYASNIIASNLDIYDNNGNLISEKCAYADVDWSLIYNFQK